MRGHRSDRHSKEVAKSTPTYFVPSFGINRDAHFDQQQEQRIAGLRKEARRVLGRHTHFYDPPQRHLTIVEQRAFIERIRESGIRPTPEQITELVKQISGGLKELLGPTPAKLVLPLGKLARFGERKETLGIQPWGWRGFRAHYAIRNELNELSPLGAIVAETQFTVGAITTAMEETTGFSPDGLAQTPHIAIAEKRGGIRYHEFVELEGRLSELDIPLPDECRLDDPIIHMRTMRKRPRQSEVVMPRGYNPPPRPLDDVDLPRVEFEW